MFFQLQNCLVSGFLFRCFFRPSASCSIDSLPDLHFHSERFVVIRTFFFNQVIRDSLFHISLYDLLQNSLAIIKEFFVLQICQDKPMNKLFCISKTTVQLNRADQSLHRIRCHRRPLTSSCCFFSLSEKQITAQFDLPRTKRQRRLTHHTRSCFCQLSFRYFR